MSKPEGGIGHRLVEFSPNVKGAVRNTNETVVWERDTTVPGFDLMRIGTEEQVHSSSALLYAEAAIIIIIATPDSCSGSLQNYLGQTSDRINWGELAQSAAILTSYVLLLIEGDPSPISTQATGT